MIDGKQASIIRPKAVPPMFTRVLTPNSQATTNMNQTLARPPPQQALIDMSGILRKNDPEATRLHDCIGQVKIFSYNSTELRWENAPNIEGNLCLYERQQLVNNVIAPSNALAVINMEKIFIQPITVDMAHHVDKLRLFYEVARNGRREVFCVHFLNEAECGRLHSFLSRSIQMTQKIAEQQQQHQQQHHHHQQSPPQPPPAPAPVPVPVPQQQPMARAPVSVTGVQAWMQSQVNGQASTPIAAASVQQTPNNVYRQTPMVIPNSNLSTTPQFGTARMAMNQTPTRFAATSSAPASQQAIPSYSMATPIDISNTNLAPPINPTATPFTSHIDVAKPLEQTPFPPSPVPLTNGNNGNAEDPTLSLKRLLNIRSQTGIENLSLDDVPVFPKVNSQSNTIDLMPPSAFEPITATPPSPVVAIGAERLKYRISHPGVPTISRDHFRNVLLHLIQNDDHFLDIIYQACLTYPNVNQ